MDNKSVSIVGHEQLGIRVFKNSIQNSANLIDTIERVAGGKQSGQCLWQPAQVGLYTNDFDDTINSDVEDGKYSAIDLSNPPYNITGEYTFEWQSCFFKKKVYKVI